MTRDLRGKPAKGLPRSKGHALGAEKLTPAEQKRRFIEAAREAGASEDEAEFDRQLGKLVKGKS